MATAQPVPTRLPRGLWIALIVGGAVSLAAGVFGSVHDPTGQQTVSLFFSNTLSFKAWTTTAILLLGLFQLWWLLRMWGQVSWPGTRSRPASA